MGTEKRISRFSTFPRPLQLGPLRQTLRLRALEAANLRAARQLTRGQPAIFAPPSVGRPKFGELQFEFEFEFAPEGGRRAHGWRSLLSDSFNRLLPLPLSTGQ